MKDESCEKSRARNVAKFLSTVDAPGRELENFRHGTNKFKEIPCIFFVNIIRKTENNTPSNVFR